LQVANVTKGPGVNFINNLSAPFFIWKYFFATFLYLDFGFEIFVKRILAQKLVVKCWWNWLKGKQQSQTVWMELRSSKIKTFQLFPAQKRSLVNWRTTNHQGWKLSWPLKCSIHDHRGNPPPCKNIYCAHICFFGWEGKVIFFFPFLLNFFNSFLSVATLKKIIWIPCSFYLFIK